MSGKYSNKQMAMNNNNGERNIKKKINKKDFKKYISSKNLHISNDILDNAIRIFNATDKLQTMMYTEGGLSMTDRNFVNKEINLTGLKEFIKVRYMDKIRIYSKNTKKELINYLKHPRYSTTHNTNSVLLQRGGYYKDLQVPQAGFDGSMNTLTTKTLDFSFPDIVKNNS